MIDQTVFNNKKAAYYTLGCKLNFAETSTIGKLLAEQGVRKPTRNAGKRSAGSASNTPVPLSW